MIRQSGSGAVAFTRALVLIAVLLVGAPWALVAAARARFDGGSPLHGVASPADWQADRIKEALTDRLTDQTIADIVIRTSLILAWAAIVVLVVTTLAEIVHMLRHDGLSMPEIRGLGMPQSVARVIATGLLVVVPMFTAPSRAVARDGLLLPEQDAAASLSDGFDQTRARPDNVWVAGASVEGSAPRVPADSVRSIEAAVEGAQTEPGSYVVRAGDSIYAIAGRLAGPDPASIAEFAERLIDINLDTVMPDGQRFTNAAYIDVGWVLQLPPDETGRAGRDLAGQRTVEHGESLWSIADDELGDGRRWPEIFEANEGRVFDDGRRLVDPDLIQPGWGLHLPGTTDSDPVAAPPVSPPDDESAARPENVWEPWSVPETPTGADLRVGDDSSENLERRSADDQDAVHIADPVVASPTDPASFELVPATPTESGAPDRQAPADGSSPTSDATSQGEAPELLTLTRAAMLSAGVLTLLAVRRRNQLRRARPRALLPEPATRPAETERSLRAIDTGDLFARVDIAVRAAASTMIDHGQRLVAVLISAEGDLELRLSGPVELPAPWIGGADVWQLPGTTPLELLAEAAGRVGPPCPTLVQLGRAVDGRDIYVDLEACRAIEVGGPADQADAIVAAVAATLAGSVLAEVTTLIGVGVPDEAFLGHRLHVPALDSQRAFEAAREAVGSTAAADRSTFELRARAVAGEVWEPAVVLAGSAAGTVTLPSGLTGVAVVSASPIHGPSSRLAPDGDAWELKPAGLRLLPIGLSMEETSAIAELVDVDVPAPEPLQPFRPGPDDTITDHDDHGDHGDLGDLEEFDEPVVADDDLLPATVAGGDVDALVGGSPAPSWELMVRLLGPVEVVSSSGAAVSFERSKTRELVAWLATHRGRSTRAAARTALWELDVRDATFANVVSEARRSLARLVEPPAGDEWVGRTMTEALPLHALVSTDADLLEHALDAARLQPPAQAIATLSPAVELITGMPFEGTSYLWPDPEGITSNLVLLATSGAAELAAHCLSIGDITGVFRATGRGLQVLPGHEELIGLRMQAHARAGDHAGVRQEWESYERVITADPWSDGEPSPKLVELRSELLNPSR